MGFNDKDEGTSDRMLKTTDGLGKRPPVLHQITDTVTCPWSQDL